MAHVIDESRVGATASDDNRDGRPGVAHPSPGQPAFAESPTTAEAPADRQGLDSADDSRQGLALFVIFIGAVLVVTGAVAVLALVDSWLMLGVAFALDVTVTAFVVLTVYRTLAGLGTQNGRAHRHDTRFEWHRTLRTGQSDARADVDPRPAPAVAQNGGPESPWSPQASSPPAHPMRRRVLMVTDESLAQPNEVPDAIRPLVDEAEVYVVAPTLTTRLQSLTGDVDGARVSAQARLRTVFEHRHADGLRPRGSVGDEDQVAAIADALANFDADLMVLRLHAQDAKHENWRERRLAQRVRSHFNVPTVAFFFDDDGQVVRQDGQDPGQDAGDDVASASTESDAEGRGLSASLRQ